MAMGKDKSATDQELFRDLINKSNDAIFVADPRTGLFIFVNDKACASLGYKRQELLTMGVMDIEASLPDNFSWQKHADELRRKGSLIFEGVHKRKNGVTFPVEANISHAVLNTGEYLVTVVRDITERKRTEGALKEREKQLAESQRIAHIGSWEHNLKTDRAFWSDELFRLFGLDPQKDPADIVVFFDLVHPDDRPKLKKAIDETLRERKPYSIDYRLIRTDGTVRILHAQAEIVADDAGDPVILSGTAQDITERKRAEEELRLSEERFCTLAGAAFEAIAVSEEGNLVDANRQFCDMVGYSLDELRGMPVINFIAPEDRELVRHNQSIGYEAPYENRLLHKNGSVILVESRARHFTIGNRRVRVTVLRDITERKRAEQDLLKTQKLESLGILAGGIAHDFNNILTAILGNISLARMKMKPDDPQIRRLEEAERASYHARELTQQLLTFAKGGSPVKSTVSLEGLIRDSAGFAIRGSNVRCDFHFSQDLLPVDVDEGQMGQVFNNLVINACQAMPEGGTISIEAHNADAGPEEGVPLHEGRYVRITISDQGTGIPEEHLQRIFDPYFTTKQLGSGLGLSIVHSVVRNHSGTITVKSRPGAGTTFIIYLPASTKQAVEKVPEGRDDIAGKGRVLLMDDEEMVRQVTGEMLKTMGYEVEYASDGAEAIGMYEAAMASSRPFDAVIMDLTVPGGMGGKEAIKRLCETDPNVKAVVSSGYSRDPVMANYREYGFSEVIAKPFNSGELGRVMRKVIVTS
jgi:PAS domain S-box-containing protein